MENKKYNAYDKNAKRILSNKSLLSAVLQELIPEYRELDKSEVENLLSDNNDKYVTCIPLEDNNDNGAIEYDVLFTPRLPNSNDKIGVYIDIEIQNRSSKEFLLDRAVYYTSRLITRQKNESFSKYHYRDLKAVYSIWICVNPLKELRNTVIKYSLKGEVKDGSNRARIKGYNKINIFFINLDEANSNSGKILDIFNIIFKSINTSSVKSQLQNKYNIIVSDKEVIEMTNFEASSYYAGVDDGMKKGRIEGKIEAILNLIKSGMDKELILSSSGLSDDLIETINRILKEQ